MARKPKAEVEDVDVAEPEVEVEDDPLPEIEKEPEVEPQPEVSAAHELRIVKEVERFEGTREFTVGATKLHVDGALIVKPGGKVQLTYEQFLANRKHLAQ